MACYCEKCGSIGKWDDYWKDYELWVLMDKHGNPHEFCPRCYYNQNPSQCDHCGDWFIGGSLTPVGSTYACSACVEYGIE